MIVFIVGCEIAFWVILVAGLVCRYPLRRPRLGAVLLACTVLTDVVLLLASVLDLRGGGIASFAHAIAAIYLGFSVVFGPSMIRWADGWFAYLFAGGPRPRRRYGRELARHELREFGKAVLACAISAGLLLAAIGLIDDAGRTEALRDVLSGLPIVLFFWAVIAVIDVLWPTKAPST